MKPINQRELAVFALIDILEAGGYNNIVLKRTLKSEELTSQQNAFITELVNGTLRNMIHIDYILDEFSKTQTKKMKPLVLNILRISVYQIKFMPKIPESAICNEAVNLVKAKGYKNLAPFVNGVLRNILRNKDNILYPEVGTLKYISVMYSFPYWLIKYFSTFLTPDIIEEICKASTVPPKLSICINTLKITREELLEELAADGVEATLSLNNEDCIYITKTSDITKLKSFEAGHFHVMDEVSMEAVKTLAPKPFDLVYDICAAPGGKTFYMAQLMEDQGEIQAWDIHPHKLKLIEYGAKRLGINIITPAVVDALKHDKKKANTADCVLIDAPCTGFGTLNKKPDIKYNKTFEDVQSLAGTQMDILKNASTYVKKGGTLVYSTCTISAEENEKNIDWFIQNFDFDLISQKQYLPQPNGSSDGFFIAHMIRR